MATPQFISPATIGEQTALGGPVVGGGLGQVTQPVGSVQTGYSSRRYTFVLDTVVPSYDLNLGQSFCRAGAAILNLSGSDLFRPLSFFAQTAYGSAFVWNYSQSITILGVGFFSALRPLVSDQRVDLLLSDTVCRSVGSQVLDFDGNRLLKVVGNLGLEWSVYGTPKFIISQFVYPSGFVTHRISAPTYVTASFVDLDLSRTLCQQGFIRNSLSFPDLSTRLIPIGAGELSGLGRPTLVQTPRWLTMAGDTHGRVGRRAFVSALSIWLYLNETLCVQGTALQHHLGESRGLSFIGVGGGLYGSPTFVQGPPKILLPGLDAFSSGAADVAIPEPQYVFTAGHLSQAFGLADFFLRDQFLYPSGLFTPLLGAHDVFEREPPRPDGFDASEFGDPFVSWKIRWVYPDGVDFLGVGSPTAQLAMRFLYPVWDAMDSISSPVVWAAVWGGVLDTKYGGPVLEHLLTPIGPMPGQETFEAPNTHKFEHGLRYLDGWDAVPQPPIPGPLVWPGLRFVAPYSSQEHARPGEYTHVFNKNIPIFPVGEGLGQIPYTHTLGYNPDQKFFQGLDAALYGSSSVDLLIRRIYPSWTPVVNVFNPNMRVVRTPVVFAPSLKQDGYGYPHVRILTQWVFTTGQALEQSGTAFIGDAVRPLPVQGVSGFETRSIDHSVRLAWRLVSPSGLDFFVQPWATTYLEERFTRIEPFHLGKADYGVAQVRNLNQESVFFGWTLDRYGSADVSLFTRYLELGGLSGSVGYPWIGDPTQILYGWVGEDYAEYGVHSIYWGQPWLPFTQIVQQPGNLDFLGLGSVTLSRNPESVYPHPLPGDEGTKYGAGLVQGQAAGFGFQTPSTEYGFPIVLAAVPQFVKPEGVKAFSSAKPRLSPDHIYATGNFPYPPNPYEGTEAWHPPDQMPSGYPLPPGYKRPGVGKAVISNFIRTFGFPSLGNTALFGYFEVAHKLPDIGVRYITPSPGALEYYGVPNLLGGVRRITIWAGPLFEVFGSAEVVVDPVSVPLPPISPGGVSMFQAGAPEVQLLIRRVYPHPVDGADVPPGSSSTDPEDFFKSITVSRSPRFLEPFGSETLLVGDSWVSFLVRYVSPEGQLATGPIGLSPNAFLDRFEVHLGVPSAVYPAYPLGVDGLAIGKPVIDGGCC